MTQPAVQQPSHQGGGSFDRVIDALTRSGRRIKGSPRRRDVMAQCSMHEPDRNPSMHVTWDADGGKTSLWCFSCRADETDLAEAAGLTGQDLWDEPAAAQPHHPHVVQSEDAVVVYDTDPDDEVLREALKQCNFRWDPLQRRWNLPEHWKATTRTGKVTKLLRLLQQSGRPPLPVQRVDTAVDVDAAAPRVGRSTAQRRAGKRWGKLGPLPAVIPVEGEEESPRSAATEHATTDWHDVTSYGYRDDNGVVIHRVTRQECTCPERHKNMPQTYRVPGTDTWVDVLRDAPGFVSVLYRQPEVRAAVADGRTVLLSEGEKDVDAVVAAGWDVTPTTNPGGSASFQVHHAEVLRGAGEVWVVLDRDDAGYQRGVRVSRLLADVDVGNVRFFLPAVVDDKADVFDHIAAGYSADDLDEVSLEEVSAWAELATARQWHDKVLEAAGQVRAQIEAADAGDEVAAQAAQRHAVRWTAQAEMWLERVGEAADQVVLADATVATPWSRQAATIAENKRARSTHTVVRAFQTVGLAVPAHLTPDTAVSVEEPASTAADPEPGTAAMSADSEQATVTPPPPVGLRIQRNRYRLDEDGIWELRSGKDPDAPDAWALLLNLDLRITAWEVAEAEDGVDDGGAQPIGIDRSQTGIATVPTVVAVRVAWTNQRSGEIQYARIEYEDFKTFDWLSGLGLSVETGAELSSRGKARLYSAMLALYGDVGQSVLHRATGWRHDAAGSGSYFVHAGGAIGPAGPRSAEIELDHELSRYALPNPTDSPELLRTAFLDYSAGLLTRIPARIAAPVLGAVYRSAIGHNPWVLGLIGPPGTYKTAVAAIAMHHWGQEFQDGRASVSKRPGSDTDNTVQFKTHAAKDTLFWADDFTKVSGVAKARQQLEDFIGLIHNKVGRGRMRRDSDGIKPARPPRGSGLVTSELMPSSGSSSYQRLFPVPMVDSTREFLEPIKPFSHEDSRFQRNLLMASLVQWLTTRLDDCRLRAAAAMDEWAETLMEHGHEVRLGQAVGSTYAGWVVMTDFLVDVGAVTGGERDTLLSRVRIALLEAAGMAVDPDNPAHLGPRIVEMLRHTVTSAAHVVDSRTGAVPNWPLAARLGWTRTPMRGMGGPEVEYRYDKAGEQLGYLLYDETGAPTAVGFEKVALDEALKAASGRASDGPQIDRVTAQQELAATGAIVTETNGNKRKRKCTVKRVVPYLGDGITRAPTRSLIVMPLERLFDDHDGDDDEDAPTAGWGDGPMPDLLGTGAGPPQSDCDANDDSFTEEPMPHTEPAVSAAATIDAAHLDGDDSIEVGEFVDRDGIASPAVLRDEVTPCLGCGEECGFWFGGLAVHPSCWETSTDARRRERLHAQVQQSPAPVTKPAPQTSGTTERIQVAVLDVDGAVLPDGSTRPLPEPCTHLGHLGQIAHDLDLGIVVNSWRDKQTKELIEHRTGGTVVVTEALAARLGVDLSDLDFDDRDSDRRIGEMTVDQPLVTGAITEGWNLGAPGDRMHKWTRMWADQPNDHGERKSVSFVFRPGVDTTFLEGDPDHATLAHRLQRYATALGEPFYMSPQTTGLELLRRGRWSERKEILAPLNRKDLPPPARMGGLIADTNWSRTPMEHELRMPYVMAFDRGGSYLPTVSSLNLGLGQWTHHPEGVAGGSDELDMRVPGYHRIRVPEVGDVRLPFILDPAGRGEQETWVMTPQLDMARSLDYQIDILESYVWYQYKRVLEPWYKRVRDARSLFNNTDDPEDEVLKKAVKDLYSVFVGHLAHYKPEDPDKRREGYAPHWRHSIVAKANHAIVYMIHKIGAATDRWPLAVSRDSVIYAVDSLEPKQAWPGDETRYGTGLGQYSFEGIAHMADHREFFTGKKYAGKKHLMTLEELSETKHGGGSS